MRKLTLWQAVALSTQFGFILAAAVAVGLFLGWVADHWWQLGVMAYLVGALIGFASGVYSVVKLARTFSK